MTPPNHLTYHSSIAFLLLQQERGRDRQQKGHCSAASLNHCITAEREEERKERNTTSDTQLPRGTECGISPWPAMPCGRPLMWQSFFLFCRGFFELCLLFFLLSILHVSLFCIFLSSFFGDISHITFCVSTWFFHHLFGDYLFSSSPSSSLADHPV